MASGRRRSVRILGAATALFVVLGGVLYYRDGRCGQRVRGFDFGDPPCAPASRPVEADVRIAYLGVGGILVEWRGAALVTTPYYTRQGFSDVLFGKLRVDPAALARGVEGFDPQAWDVLLSGHSHYDHLADVPELMTRHASRAELWTNKSGARMLAAFPALAGRLRLVEDEINAWVRPQRDGEPLPFRFMPLESAHAPHLYGIRFAHGTVEEDWDSWDGRSVRSMRDGTTTNYLIDLLDGETTVFRIFYQGSAAPGDVGRPPAAEIGRRPVDVAILCVPPYWQVDGYPEGPLETTQAGYVLPIHYEDFFRPAEAPLRFVRSLTDARFERLLERIENSLRERDPVAPKAPLCGPGGERWSVPLPGEWLGFDAAEPAVLTSNQP